MHRRATGALHCRHLRSLALGGPLRLPFCFGLHLGKAGVVIRKLVEVGSGDLRRHECVIAGDIRLGIARAMLELHVHPHPELLEIKWRGGPVQADPLTRGAGLVKSEV